MKINKTILVGILFIIIALMLFKFDFLNPIIRPVTYLFLMGSSKGKDIIFFALMGVFLIASQLIRNVNNRKYLKTSIVLGSAILILGIILEIIFRYQMGITLNTIFMSVENGISSTSILHTHLLKSILGEVITNIIGASIESNINTGIGLYNYIPEFAKIIILLLPAEFSILILANTRRTFPSTFLLAFFSSCLLIGALDGGLFSTPAITGICGVYLIYRNEYYIDYYSKKIFKLNYTIKSEVSYRNLKKYRFIINRLAPYIAAGLIIFLRLTIGFFGADVDYYEVDVVNPTNTVELNEFPIENIIHEKNKTIYYINSDYNEMELLNNLKTELNNSCEYYTVSWNIFSYVDKKSPATIFLLNLKKNQL